MLPAVLSLASADDRASLKEPLPPDPEAPDIVAQFHKLGSPKYTLEEQRIIDRARKLQNEHSAMYERVEKGKSVFDYPGLIAHGPVRYDPKESPSYSLVIGIRAHNSVFAGAFREYRIVFDEKGIVRGKSKLP